MKFNDIYHVVSYSVEVETLCKIIYTSCRVSCSVDYVKKKMDNYNKNVKKKICKYK